MKKTLFVFLILNTVFGVTHNVPADFSEIQLAIDSAVEGDTILVAPGTYYENLYIDTNLIIHSTDGPEETIIDGSGIDRVVYFYIHVDNSTEFSGFTIINGYVNAENWDAPPEGYGGGLLCAGATPELSDLIISNNYGRKGGGLAFYYTYYYENYANINNVQVRNNESVWDAVYITTHARVNIVNCVISENTSTMPSGGIEIRNDSRATVVNTIIFNNAGNITYPIIFDEDNESNILTITYSDIEGGEAGVNTHNNGVLNWLEGNIDADPMLDDEYHLMTGSPCIDAGTAYFEWGEFLLDLGPDDYLGLAPDIGVYEFVGLLGDLNADGDINVTDIVLLVDIILTEPGTPYEMWAADYNEDGLVNVSDIVQIVFVILNPPGRTMTVSTTANYQLTENEFVLTVDGAVAGIQLTTSGGYLITDNYLPNGWEFHENGMTVLAFSLDGTSINSGPLFSYGGNLEIVEIIITDWNGNNVATLTPNQFTLHPAYPNPFNPMTNLSYDLPEDTDLTIAIYDLQGRMVEELANGHVSSGSYKVTWQADNQPSGMYFVQMVTGATVQTQKIILLK